MKLTHIACTVLFCMLMGCAPTGNKPGAEGKMAGIVFFKTTMLNELTRFYVDEVGCRLWMDQTDCRIFRHGSFLFGFCQREQAETGGILTFFYPERKTVDRMYDRFRDRALGKPRMNPNYPIYNFFATDPEGRTIEFQYFTNAPEWEF